MNQGAQPNPAQVPTLTEVIELLSPAPVRDAGLGAAPRPDAPAAGSAAAAPIVTGGLPASQPAQAWVPMTTVVVPSLESVPKPPPVTVAELPVLQDAVASIALPVAQAPVQVAMPALAHPAAAPAAAVEPLAPEVSEAQLAQRVFSDVQRQIDGMLDFRLREAIGPVLARHSEALIRDLREELNRTMRDVVARSVAQEMAKRRQR